MEEITDRDFDLIFKDSQVVKTLLGLQNRRSLRALVNSVTAETEKTGAVKTPGGDRLLQPTIEIN